MALESLQVAESLAGVDREEWNALAGPQPFVRHQFLSALLETGCASGRSGWLPRFLLLRRSGALAGAMPLFAKSHSYGEYVFDWAWAEAHERHGLDYYPKLLCAIPFTPVRGARLLAGGDREHEANLLREQGMLLRRTVQFHWRNEGYADFEGFLARMSHAKRKNIRQERRRVREAGVSLRRLQGAAIEKRHWEFFNRCYRHTYAAHGSSPYLNLEFFLRMGAALAEHTVMILAERGGTAIASALLFADATTLYGRYWGAVEHVPLLHFECCYYQPIEHAIANGLRAFEGGAQGEHKLFRGLLPVETLSAHWLAHPRFAQAVEQFLEREGTGVSRYVNELCEHSPFKDQARDREG
jgi:predicted N-acyltransferase